MRDHCHVTGNFRGAAHRDCNLKLPSLYKLPVFFHNFRGYDAHLIARTFGDFNYQVEVIPQGMEKYMMLRWGKTIQFKDSLMFMNSSLAKLVDNLAAAGVANFPLLSTEFPADKLPLLVRKGVYPYDYTDSEARFDELTLPPQ